LFLHQIDGDGLCGWWPFAAWLTQHYPVRAVLADLCGYGASYCPDQSFAADQLRQVRVLAHDTARPGRFVLVGASMGGALALASAAAIRAAAVVDLSGRRTGPVHRPPPRHRTSPCRHWSRTAAAIRPPTTASFGAHSREYQPGRRSSSPGTESTAGICSP
jgi:pimeloyl-ACP methyl ester carboxylesterase